MKNSSVKRLCSLMLAVMLMLSCAVSAMTAAAAGETLPTLTVDMTPQQARNLKHGASGWLYGLGAEGVPSTNTITPLKPNTTVQKAPNGMQHANGDTLDVATTFLNSGGKDIQIYVPDYYALWFYEFSSTKEYMKILRMEAEACIQKGIAEDVTYVLYNEPYDGWTGGSYTDPETGTTVTGWDSLFWFWEDMCSLLKQVYAENNVPSQPKICGLNLAAYDEGVMDRYIKFCVEHNCLPDVISWHDLSTWQFNNFGWEYSSYRNLESKYFTQENAQRYGIDITPREIIINEYAEPVECASPGDLVRWIGLFEEYNVAACLPFWHISNNLNGLAASNNEGTGAWWLYKWYGDMSGSYLPVAVSNSSKDDYYGVASLDNNKKSANVVFGGINGSSEIVLDDIIGTQTFKDSQYVHVKLEATDYTGFHGAADEPRIVSEGCIRAENGSVTVPVYDMHSMSAYRITVTQATEDEAEGFYNKSWKRLYEAEDGRLLDGAAISPPANDYACSGRSKVGHLETNESVEVAVDVPASGYYKYDMIYTNACGCDTNNPSNHSPRTAIQNLIIDSQQIESMVLPSTLQWSMGGMYSTYVYLSKGSHSIRIQATGNQRYADVDCFYLTYCGPTEDDTKFSKTYQAELGDFNELVGNTTQLTTEREASVDYVSGLHKVSVANGGGLRFNAVVPDNRMYSLRLRYSSGSNANANIYVGNDAVNLDRLSAVTKLSQTNGAWADAYQTIFLQKGINIIDIDTDSAIKLDYIALTQTDIQPTVTVEAESGLLTGSAAIGRNNNVRGYASDGGYISGIKVANGVAVISPDSPEFSIYGLGKAVDMGEAVDKNSLTITVEVPEAGQYSMAVYQSNGQLFGKHAYNTKLTERYASFSINGSAPKKVVFRNSYSDETFRPQIVPVTLEAGVNTIKIYNDNSKVITNGILKDNATIRIPENINYSALENYTPNFDKFVFYPAASDQVIAEQQSYSVSASYWGAGIVTSDRLKVREGESVTLTFSPNNGAVLQSATVNGTDIFAALGRNGGEYTVENVRGDIDVTASFKDRTAITVTKEYLYSVNCGDIDPTTLSPGDIFGKYNSVTDQFYSTDPQTGRLWGVVDSYKYVSAYPAWLTGEKTWPCENDGANDSSPRAKSFRYLKDMPTTDEGIIYKFQLEPDKTYNVTMGFYVPSAWTNASYPRTMKLCFNGMTYLNSFSASNNSSDPLVLNYNAAADSDGFLTIRIGHADNAVWGPVVSYIDIATICDKTLLEEAIDRIGELNKDDYSAESWNALEDALVYAIAVDESTEVSQQDVDNALEALLAAEGLLEAPPEPVNQYAIISVNGRDYENGMQVKRDAPITAVLRTPADVAKLGLFNETMKGITKTTTKATGEDYTDWTFTFTTGTKGYRELSLGVKTDGDNDWTIIDEKLILDIGNYEAEPGDTPANPGVISVETESATARANEIFKLTVVTTAGIERVGLFNESGSGISKSLVSRTVSDDRIVWVFNTSVSSKGANRIFTAKGYADGEWLEKSISFAMSITK